MHEIIYADNNPIGWTKYQVSEAMHEEFKCR